jgi:fumarate reductase subunit C
MSDFTEYRQRLYRPRVPALWWLRRRTYLVFVLRELTSVFVAWAVAFTLMAVSAILAGPEAYERFVDWAGSPLLVVLNVVALAFLVFHTITWFNLTPHAVAVRVGGRRLPNAVIAAPLYVAWVLVSAFLVWIVVG